MILRDSLVVPLLPASPFARRFRPRTDESDKGPEEGSTDGWALGKGLVLRVWLNCATLRVAKRSRSDCSRSSAPSSPSSCVSSPPFDDQEKPLTTTKYATASANTVTYVVTASDSMKKRDTLSKHPFLKDTLLRSRSSLLNLPAATFKIFQYLDDEEPERTTLISIASHKKKMHSCQIIL